MAVVVRDAEAAFGGGRGDEVVGGGQAAAPIVRGGEGGPARARRTWRVARWRFAPPRRRLESSRGRERRTRLEGRLDHAQAQAAASPFVGIDGDEDAEVQFGEADRAECASRVPGFSAPISTEVSSSARIYANGSASSAANRSR